MPAPFPTVGACPRPRSPLPSLRTVLLRLAWAALPQVTAAVTLQVQITPVVSGEPLQPASLRYQTSAGETFAVTRVSWLASAFALQRLNGSWLELSNSVAWFDAELGREAIQLDSIPPGEYQSLRFLVGLDPSLNHANPARFPTTHPLNPNLNGLHWSWQGGFIFLALEGLWRNPAGELDGWAYHLARDTNAVTITLAAPLSLTGNLRLQVAFDLAAVLHAPRPLSFKQDGSSTHSRDGDPIAAALGRSLRGAFSVRRISTLTANPSTATPPPPPYLPEHFTPFEFHFSASFPLPDLPRDNPLTVERVALGRALFFDRRLSANDQQSCADCHVPARAFTDGRRAARGAEGQLGRRNSMPLFNLAWKRAFFWDGRAQTLRQQVLRPIEDPLEMHQPLTNLVAKLTRAPGYPDHFAAAFGASEVSAEKIALALENFLLTLIASDAKFDAVLRGEATFTEEEQRGFELFSTEYDPRRGQFGADCFHCHGGPLFQSQGFANNGLDAVAADPGRAQVTANSADQGKFAVPSLRNIALTAPYMHDGRFETLEQVIEHYTTGVKRSATLDPNLAKHPNGGVPLSAGDKKALAAFLRTLTDRQFE